MEWILTTLAMLRSRQQKQYTHRLLFASGILFLAALACNLPWSGGTPTSGESIGTIQKEFSDVIQNAVQVETENPLNENDSLRVQNGGVGLLKFGDYLRLRLFNDSMVGEVKGTRMASDPTIPLIAKMTLFAGGFSGQLFKPGSKATFTTPGGAQIVVLGTEFFVVYDPETGITTVGNFSGTMGVIAGGESVPLASGQYLEVPRGGTPGEQQQTRFSLNEFEDRARVRKSPILALLEELPPAVAQVPPPKPSDPFSTDADKDGLPDGDESSPCPDPTNPDTDGDGFIDGQDIDPCDPINPSLTLTAKASIPTGTSVTPVPPTTQAPTKTPTSSHTPTPTNTATNTPTPSNTSTPILDSFGIPTFIIREVVPDISVSISTQNLPAIDQFVITMGPKGSRGVGGFQVGIVNSGSGGNQEYTFNIPRELWRSELIAIRMESESGYFAYNWFINRVFSITYGLFPGSPQNSLEDTYLSEANPRTVYGAEKTLLVDGGDPPRSGQDLLTLMRWDLSSIPPESKILDARLILNITNPSDNQDFYVYEILRNWQEYEATWEMYASGQNWQIPGASGFADRGTTVVAEFSTDQEGLVEIKLNAAGIALVQAWVDDPSSNFGFVISNSKPTHGMEFSSKEVLEPGVRPRLTLNLIPSPEFTLYGNPDELVETYWKLVSENNYLAAWNLLSPDFKLRMHRNSFADYQAGYRNSNYCRIEPRDVQLQEMGENQATVSARVVYFTNYPDCDETPNNFEIRLVFDESRRAWLYDRTE